MVAGVHFPIDSAAGYVLADALFEYLARRANAGTFTSTRVFEVDDPMSRVDFDPSKVSSKSAVSVTAVLEKAPNLAWLWGMAKKEQKI